MTVNTYFNHINYQPQQDLVNDLIIESIQMRGVDLKYIIRDDISDDYLYGESPLAEYTAAIPIEMYIEDVQNFNGDGDLFSKFGLEMTDKVTLLLSQERFKTELLSHDIKEPREGDLVFIPFSDSLYEIKKVKYDEEYYQWGANYTYRLSCELFEFSFENLATGDSEIDDFSDYATSKITEEGILEMELEQNGFQTEDADLELENENYIGFNPKDPFNDGVIY